MPGTEAEDWAGILAQPERKDDDASEWASILSATPNVASDPTPAADATPTTRPDRAPPPPAPGTTIVPDDADARIAATRGAVAGATPKDRLRQQWKAQNQAAQQQYQTTQDEGTSYGTKAAASVVSAVGGSAGALEKEWADALYHKAKPDIQVGEATPQQEYKPVLPELIGKAVGAATGTGDAGAAVFSPEGLQRAAQIAQTADPVTKFAAGLAAMPASMLTPSGIAAMLITHAPSAAMMEAFGAPMVGKVEQMFGVRVAAAVHAELQASTGLAMFSGTEAALRGGSGEDILSAAGTGAVQGLAFGVPGAIKGVMGKGAGVVGGKEGSKLNNVPGAGNEGRAGGIGSDSGGQEVGQGSDHAPQDTSTKSLGDPGVLPVLESLAKSPHAGAKTQAEARDLAQKLTIGEVVLDKNINKRNRTTEPDRAPGPQPGEPAPAPEGASNDVHQEEGQGHEEGLLTDEGAPPSSGRATPPPAPAETGAGDSTTTPTPESRGYQSDKVVSTPKKPGPFTRADLEDRILAEHEKSPTRQNREHDDENAVEQSGQVNAGDLSGFTSFRETTMPGELRSALEGKPEIAKKIRLGVTNEATIGSDQLATLGGERYVQVLERKLKVSRQKELGQAKADLRKDAEYNPQGSFLADLHDSLPKGKSVPKEAVYPDNIRTGAKFTINGHDFTVTEDANGIRVLKDGADFDPVPIDALDAVPVDKGSNKDATAIKKGAGRPQDTPAPEKAPEAAPAPAEAADPLYDPEFDTPEPPKKIVKINVSHEDEPPPEPKPKSKPKPESKPESKPAAPKEPEADRPESDTTGIAHRVSEERGNAAPRGEGIPADEWVERGRALINTGTDPEKVLADFDKTKSISAEGMAVARAHAEQLAKAARQASQTHGAMSPEYKAAFRAESDWIERVKPMQTEWANAGQAQQGEVEIDTGTFHGLHRAYKEATGKEFTPKQAREAERKAAAVQEATRAAEAAKQKVYEGLDKAGAGESPSEQTKSIADRIVSHLDKAANEALARFKNRQKSPRLLSGIPVDDLYDLSVYGAAKIAKGLTRFAEWSVEMIKDVGESIRPHLKEIWDAADKELERRVAHETSHEKEVKEAAKTPATAPAKKPYEVTKRLSSFSSSGKLARIAKDLSRLYIREGIVDREKNLDAVHKALQWKIPEITREQTADVLSGYGDFKTLSKDPVETRRRQIAGEILQTRKLEDMAKGKAPLKSGVERQTPTDEARDLIRRVNEAKKEGGYTVTDPEAELKSATESRKTWLRNRITDLQKEIDTGARTVKGKPVKLTDPQIAQLKERLDKVKERHADVFPPPDKTPQQIQALKDQIAELDRHLKAGTVPAKAAPAKTPPKAIADLREQRAKLRAQVMQADPAKRAEIQAQIKTLEDHIKNGTKPTPKTTTPAPADIQALRDRRNALARQLNAAAPVDIGAHPPGTTMTPERVKALWKTAKDNYIDKGVADFNDVVHGLATDYGLPVDDIRRGLAQPKGVRTLTDAMYTAQAARRRVVTEAKTWVDSQSQPKWMRVLTSIPRGFFSAKVFGHGTVGMITHAGNQIFDPTVAKEYWTNFGRQFKLIGMHDKGAYHEQMMADLVRGKNYTTARRAGLANDPYRFTDDYQKGGFSEALGKLGLNGNKGFDALKLFRQDLFNKKWDRLPSSLKTPENAKMIAQAINHATGYVEARVGGSVTAAAIFAPKLEGSRWAFLIGDPALAAKRFLNWKNETPEAKSAAISEVRQKAIIAATYLSALAINQGLLSATGSDQSVNFTDPSKSDWLAFKVAGHKVGVVSPMIGVVRFLANLVRASAGDRSRFEANTSSRAEKMYEVAGEYARSKASPFGKVVVDTVSQSDYQGRPMPFSSDRVPPHVAKKGLGRIGYGEYLGETMLPIPLENALVEAMKSQGADDDAIHKMMRVIGVGVSGVTGAHVSEDHKK